MTAAEALEVFGDRGGPGMMALLAKGGNAIRDMEEAITGTNAATDMATKQLDTYQGSLKLLESQMEEIQIILGNILIPMLAKLMSKRITPLLYKIMDMSEASQELAVKIGLVVGQ